MKGGQGKGRSEVLYGRQPVREMLKAGRRRVFEVRIAAGARAGAELDEIRDLAAEAGAAVLTGRPAAADREVLGAHHQGVFARVSPYPYARPEDARDSIARAGDPPLAVLLDHIQDPQNLGSIVRTAEAAGACAVFIPADRAAGVTPAVVRASSGATEHIAIVRVTNLVRTMKDLKKAGLWLSGLEDAPHARSFAEADLAGPVGLVVGAEGKGLGRLVRETCDFLVRLPMRGSVNSLNAGVAVGIVLYEAVRQRIPASAAGLTGSVR